LLGDQLGAGRFIRAARTSRDCGYEALVGISIAAGEGTAFV
jgi:hypothetical protein